MRPDVPASPDRFGEITAGMTVVDTDDEEVGTVITATPGDPNAITIQDPPSGTGALHGSVPHPDEGDEPMVPADLAARLLRAGYLKLNGHGLLARDVYVEADQIADVR